MNILLLLISLLFGYIAYYTYTTIPKQHTNNFIHSNNVDNNNVIQQSISNYEQLDILHNNNDLAIQQQQQHNNNNNQHTVKRPHNHPHTGDITQCPFLNGQVL